MSEKTEVLKVWANANFGPHADTHEGKVSVIVEALGKVARGFEPGHTIMQICGELGMLETRKRTRQRYLSEKGLHWLVTRTINPEVQRLESQLENLNLNYSKVDECLTKEIAEHNALKNQIVAFGRQYGRD